MGIVRVVEQPFLNYAIKKSTLVTVNPDGSIQSLKDVYYDKEGNRTEGETKYFASLGMQYDHRVSWLEFDLRNLLWGRDEVGDPLLNPASAETPAWFSKYIFRLYFCWYNWEGAPVINPVETTFEFDGRRFYIPSEVTRNAGNFHIVLGIINREEAEGESHHNVPNENETFVSDMFPGLVIKNCYDPTSFRPVFANTQQLKVLRKTPIACAMSDDGKLVLVDAPDTTKGVSHHGRLYGKVGNQKDNYITYFGLGFTQEELATFPEKLDGFTMFMVMRYEEDGVTKVVGSHLEPTNDLDNYDDNYYDYIAWLPYEITKTSDIYQCMLIGFLEGEYYTDGVNTYTQEWLESQIEEQQFNYISMRGQGGRYHLEFTDALSTLALESSEDYYFYCSGIVTIIIDRNFLSRDIKEGGALGRGVYTPDDVLTSAYSNFMSDEDDGSNLIFGTADGGVMLASYVEDEEDGD